MINFDGELLTAGSFYLNHDNRGLRYGDTLFETIRAVRGKLLFWEDHYLRLMASMRILRMEIPMAFTMEYLETEIVKTLEASGLLQASARVRLTVFRKDGGLYLPATNQVSLIIETTDLPESTYILSKDPYDITIFKDHTIHTGLLSTLKTGNKLIQVLGSIYARENGYKNCVLLNQDKNVVEALNGNLFLVKNDILKTPPITEGCINGILRKQICRIGKRLDGLRLSESAVSPFELQDADEMFITNVITGIQPVTHYRKATFGHSTTSILLNELNILAAEAN